MSEIEGPTWGLKDSGPDLGLRVVKREVTVKLTFEGMHCWPEAPSKVSFLRTPHRHVFHVTATIPVGHNDRDLEFILVKRDLSERIGRWWPEGDLGRESCESIAERIARYLTRRYELLRARVTVTEDDENGATVEVARE